MSLEKFARSSNHETATITVLNPEQDCPVYQILSKLFRDDAITIHHTTTEEGAGPSDAVLVEKGNGDRGFAVSSLATIQKELLLVNSDIYVTGARSIEDIETPDILTNLNELPFTVQGYPKHPKEKLLLIEISRHIEAMAWRAGEGHLKTGFQYLSRLENEQGTRRVYERLGRETEVTTHVYGVPDVCPSIPDVIVHAEDDPEIEQSWFVVYQSTHHPHEAAALVAVETTAHTFEGCWTYDPDTVATIREYLETTY